MEIAHSDTYGTGFRSWEWTLPSPIRSPVFPALFSLWYRVVDTFFSEWQSVLVAHGPRLIVMPLLATLMDWFTLSFYTKHLKARGSIWVILASFATFAGLNLPTRTLANSFEASLFITALHFHLNSGVSS